MTEPAAPEFAAFDGIYLLSHSVGRPLANARDALNDGLFDPWERGGTQVWDHWLNAVGGFREAVARLLNTSAGQVCPQTNLSSALTKILGSIQPGPGRRAMLLTENDFPSMGFVMDHAAPAGTVARFIGADEDPTDIGTWERHLGDDVWLVFITHVQSNTGLATPVGEITALARERGIVSIVDVAQSAGVIPIDLQTWQADFLIGSCVKWLCGGPGAGFLWLSEEMAATAEPVDIGWFSHASPFEFDIHQFRYADSALRFWGGTPSVAPFVIGANAIAQLSGHGIDRIRRHNLQLCRLLMEAADGRCLVSPTDDDRRGGTVVVRLPEDPQARLVEALTEAGIAFDGRASGIRLSPHIYNTMAEVEAAADIIRGLANL